MKKLITIAAMLLIATTSHANPNQAFDTYKVTASALGKNTQLADSYTLLVSRSSKSLATAGNHTSVQYINSCAAGALGFAENITGTKIAVEHPFFKTDTDADAIRVSIDHTALLDSKTFEMADCKIELLDTKVSGSSLTITLKPGEKKKFAFDIAGQDWWIERIKSN